MKFTQSFAILATACAAGAHASSTETACAKVYQPVLCSRGMEIPSRFSNICQATNDGFVEENCNCYEYEAIVDLLDEIFGPSNCRKVTPRPARPENAETWHLCSAGDAEVKLVASGLEFPIPETLENEVTSPGSPNLGSALSIMGFANDCGDLEDAASFLDEINAPVTCPSMPAGAIVNMDNNPQKCTHWADSTIICEYPNVSSAQAAGFLPEECKPECPLVPPGAIVNYDLNPQECFHWEDPTVICAYDNTSSAEAAGFLPGECQPSP